ncbi:LOW QUALITY PROTEIN: hypothetical protein PHMEG_00029250 [Phytophthora megakarya]|uniref:Uncharacterized protein n=1 Tax=Phytophthora megakarya TaxID=4795 RepID=A0A225V5N5_9STRA|nr:LOW QUALITY PROTEIN: hypothetical protein PHMEG_00029250 [Phytophthora megakarya]
MKNAKIVEILYKNHTTTERTCALCNEEVEQRRGNGYNNKITYLERHHAGFESVTEKCMTKNRSPISTMVVHKDAAGTFGRVKQAVMMNSPFRTWKIPSFVQSFVTSRCALVKRMVGLIEVADLKHFSELSGEKFALVFDGFTDSTEHALANFATTRKGDESSMTSAEHIAVLEMVLSQYGMHLSDMTAIVADNMETTYYTSYIAYKKREWLAEKVKTVKCISKLKAVGCDLNPSPSTTGCYRATKQRRYSLSRLRGPDCLDAITPFDVITGKRQRNDITVATVRDIFDIILDVYEGMENGLTKIQSGTETFSRNKRRALVCLPTTSPDQAPAAPIETSSKYIVTTWIPATSRVTELVFATVKSTVGYILLVYLRKSLSHENLERIMYLKLNWDLVTLGDVLNVIKRASHTSDAIVVKI